jgi:hypothetical protein
MLNSTNFDKFMEEVNSELDEEYNDKESILRLVKRALEELNARNTEEALVILNIIVQSNMPEPETKKPGIIQRIKNSIGSSKKNNR